MAQRLSEMRWPCTWVEAAAAPFADAVGIVGYEYLVERAGGQEVSAQHGS